MRKRETYVVFNPDKLLSQTRSPLMIVLGISAIILFILGLLFGRGEQINGFEPNEKPNIDLECNSITDVEVSVIERQIRAFFSSEFSDSFSLLQGWHLFRVKVHGPYFDQDIRAGDNVGIYSTAKTQLGVFFELNQEGMNNIEIKCLDTTIKNFTMKVEPFPRDLGHSIMHINNEFDYVCFSDNHYIIFTKSNIIPREDSFFGSNLVGLREEYSEFLNHSHFRSQKFAYIPHHTDLNHISLNNFVFDELKPLYDISLLNQVIFYPQQTNPFFKRLIKKLSSKCSEIPAKADGVCINHMRSSHFDGSNENPQRYRNFSQKLAEINEKIAPSSSKGDHIVALTKNAKINIDNFNDKQIFFANYSNSGYIQNSDILFHLLNASTLICEDNDDVAAAFLIPKNANMIVVLPPTKKKLSDRLKFIMEQRKVTLITGHDINHNNIKPDCMSNDQEECDSYEFSVDSSSLENLIL